MKNLLLRYSFYGGDADITYSGFVVWTEEKFENFKTIARQIYERDKESSGYFRIRCDCDDYLPISICSWKGFIDGFLNDFKATELTEEEYGFFKKFFGDASGNIGAGSDEPYEWVFESDDWWEAFGKSEYVEEDESYSDEGSTSFDDDSDSSDGE